MSLLSVKKSYCFNCFNYLILKLLKCNVNRVYNKITHPFFFNKCFKLCTSPWISSVWGQLHCCLCFQLSVSSHLSRYLCLQNILLCFHGDARRGGCQVLALGICHWAWHPRLTGTSFHIWSISEGQDGIFCNTRASKLKVQIYTICALFLSFGC